MGFQKSGKTTLGQMLSQHFVWDWVDIDFLMEEKFKQPIQEIYAQLGEARFRNIETELIFQRKGQEKVVSLGGGVVMRQENIQHLKLFRPLIYLKISYETYLRRANSTPLFLQNQSLEQVFT